MIRPATIADTEAIADSLWCIWRQFKVRQIPSPMHCYASVEALDNEIECCLDRWSVCESQKTAIEGFFSLSKIGDDKTFKRWQFPEQAVRVEHFACLLGGEVLCNQLGLLVSHASPQSILLNIPMSLREAHWAAVKAGFRELGENSTLVGAFVWLYLDRDARHDEIQRRLRRAKVVA